MQSIPLPDSFVFPWDNDNTAVELIVQALGVVDVKCDSFVDCGRLEVFKYLYRNATKEIYYLWSNDQQSLTVSYETLVVLSEPRNPYYDDPSYQDPGTVVVSGGQVTLSKTAIKFCFGDTPRGGFKAGYHNSTHSTSWRGFRPLKEVSHSGWVWSSFPQTCEEISLDAPSLPELPTELGDFQELSSDSSAIRMDISDCQMKYPRTGEECSESIPLPESFAMLWDNEKMVVDIVVQHDGSLNIRCDSFADYCGSVLALKFGLGNGSKDVSFKKEN